VQIVHVCNMSATALPRHSNKSKSIFRAYCGALTCRLLPREHPSAEARALYHIQFLATISQHGGVAKTIAKVITFLNNFALLVHFVLQ